MSSILDRANFPLEETDVQDIPQVLDSLRERRSDLQRLLESHRKKYSESKSAHTRERHQTRIHEIVTSLQTLNTSIHHHQTLLRQSPIRELPTELLAEIFCIYMDDRVPAAFKWRDIMQAQNTLTSVCQRWRATAQGTPNLWRSVPLFLPSICGVDASSFLTNVLRAAHWYRLDARIAYAKRIPLDLHCHIRTCDDSVAVEQLWARLTRLLPNASSLALSFTSTARTFFRDRFDLPESVPGPCYPQLQQVLVHSTDNELQDAKLTTWVNSLLSRSPRISRLTLDCRLGEVIFVSQTLRYVHCQKASPDCLFHILNFATQLVELQIDMVRVGESDVPFEVTNKSLVRLRLAQSPGRTWDMLSMLTLPALRHLDLDCWQWRPLPSHAFLAFSKRSGFQLYHLTLRYEYLLDNFPDVLRAQPSLTSLRLLADTGPPSTLLEFLGNASELRSLSTLHMCCTYGGSLRVKEMLERRLEGYRTGSLDVSGQWTLVFHPARGMDDYCLSVMLEHVVKGLGRYGLEIILEEERSW